MDQNVSAVLLLVGLAVGVDYSLFYLKREREERAAGKGHRAALEAAAATSGRSVLISGVTVMIAMAGMLFSGDKTYLSFGIATMMVVGVAMIGSLTVLPALLSKLGDESRRAGSRSCTGLRRDERREPLLVGDPRPRRCGTRSSRPSLATAVLLVMALPVLQLHTAQSGLDTLPKSVPTVSTINKIQEAFPGSADPGARRDQGGRRRSPRRRKAIAAAEAAGARERPDDRPDRGRRQRRATPWPASRSRSRATAPTRCRTHALADAAQRGPAGHDRQGAGRDLRGHAAARRPRPTRTRCSSTRRRSSSASCSRSRSCCCWSRSARS